VIGVSSGVGKTTLAKQVGEKWNLPVYHLDALYWKRGWKEAQEEEFLCKMKEIVIQEKWIIEGNYTSTLPLRLKEADTIIYIERPLWMCLYRVLKRTLQFKGTTRPEMTAGCPERFSWSFLRFIVLTYHDRRREFRQLVLKCRAQGKDVRVCRNKEDEERLLKN